MNRPIFFDIQSSDPSVTETFFGAVFSWQFEDLAGVPGMRHAVTGTVEDGINGGLTRASGGLPGTFNSILVESVDECLKRIVSAGGRVVQSKMVIPKIGSRAICADPTGVIFGVVEVKLERHRRP